MTNNPNCGNIKSPTNERGTNKMTKIYKMDFDMVDLLMDLEIKHNALWETFDPATEAIDIEIADDEYERFKAMTEEV